MKEIKKESEILLNINKVSSGYKKVKKYIIPSDWDLIKLSEVAIKIGSGKTPKGGEKIYRNSGIPFIRSQNVLDNRLDLHNITYISEEVHNEMKSTKVIPNDVLLNITGGSIGRCCVVPSTFKEGNINQHVCIVRTKEVLSREFLVNILLSEIGQNQIMLNQAGGSREGLNFQQIRNFNIPLPSIKEQQKIANILSTWDKVIELKEKLIEQKKKQKKGLMHKLLTGQIRWNDSEKYTKEEIQERIQMIVSGKVPEGYKKSKIGIIPEVWDVRKAKYIFNNHTNKKHNGDLEILAATQGRGIIPRGQLDINIKYDEKSLTSYKKVEKGDFVISLRSFQGGIEYSLYEGIVSPAYTILKSHAEIIDDFYKYLFKKEDFIKRLNSVIYGIRDGKQIGYKDFGELYLQYPSVDEQLKISSIISLADKEIKLLNEELCAFKQQKKGLMQVLLTGKIRVNE
ncbi:restriction endonuclease subunit S [Peribacillus frigoritolerans]|uniref:restriction endonuclease subunit S n=1 Tax=Peribacillus frigoritolerans TaxID=450367 RepID=UPI00207A0DC3|nr:restriction endonuclease subunit S [Peribacillus frigoritolerans]USK75902.1 restriction endonuclease subunit S [Peribacillus frigoritolerans]